MLEPPISALRYLKVINRTPVMVIIERVGLISSSFQGETEGRFECDDPKINILWEMGVETARLCCQRGEESILPVFAPFGERYVLWDGCRRDREIWGGDLRSSALVWAYAFGDLTPVKNSLALLAGAQHRECDEDGMVPGSGSKHETFYEWTLWWIVTLWDYYMLTKDEVFIEALCYTWHRNYDSPLERLRKWMEKKGAFSGLLRSNRSWMYSIAYDGRLASLAALQILATESMAKLFNAFGGTETAEQLEAHLPVMRKRLHETFWCESLRAYSMMPEGEMQPPRLALDGNIWSLLAGACPDELAPTVLATLKDCWTDFGPLCVWPPFDEVRDSRWRVRPEEWQHNNTVWPFIASYEVLARFHFGDIAGGLELMQRYHQPMLDRGHHTIWEMFHVDGSLPLVGNGNMLSFCHAWGATASYALQRYVLGVRPTSPGFETFCVTPNLGPLNRTEGSVPTPKGPIYVEAWRDSHGQTNYTVSAPEGLKQVGAASLATSDLS